MARTKNTQINDINAAIVEAVTTPPPGTEETEETEAREVYELSASERIAEIKARGEIQNVTSRIYSITNKGREFVGKYEDIAEDDYLAEKYGAGKYMVFYIYRDKDGRRVQTSENFNVSELYRGTRDNVATHTAQYNVGFLGGFLENITAEKVAGIMAAVQGLKAIFAPPPPPVDVTELIKALAAPRAPSVGDAVLIKALEGVNRPAPSPAPSILTQIKELQEVKDLISNSETSQSGGDMDFLVKMGLQMLPGLLQKNGGDYQATGAAVRDNPAITGLIANDPELAGRFINAAADKYGLEAAQKLAAGFGYSFEPAPAETSTEPAAIPAEPKKG